jgi:hypothetical protein
MKPFHNFNMYYKTKRGNPFSEIRVQNISLTLFLYLLNISETSFPIQNQSEGKIKKTTGLRRNKSKFQQKESVYTHI